MAIIIDNITGETISQNFTATQQTCSYNVLLQDTTTITPFQYNRGKIEYFILDSLGVYNKIGETSKGSAFYYNFCSAGIYTVKQLLTIREIPNCGGVSPIIYQSDVTNTVTVLEYIPSLNLPAFDDCLIRGNEQTLNFVFQLNSNVCGALTSEFNIEVLEKPASSLLTGVALVGPTSPYSWVVTFDKTGTYVFNVSIRNCCTTTVKQLTIQVCQPFQITPDCCKCGTFNLNNLSNTVPVSYTVTQLYPEVNTFIPATGNVEANKKIQYETQKDGVFEIKYIDTDNIEKSKLYYVFCLIDNCINSIIKNILCTDCSDCPGEPNIKEREKLNKITLLAQLYYKWIDDEMDGKSYDLFPDNKLIDYNNRLKDLYQIDDIYNKILEICSNCSGNASSGCGCGCS